MKKIKILYEDKYLIVVYKPYGVYTISRDNHYDNNLYDDVKTYVKKQNPRNKIFIVHRLDKNTSGLIMFAKDEKVKYEMQNAWQNVERKYYAVVSGKLASKKGALEDYLYETKSLDVIVTKDKRKGKLAITKYNTIASNNKYSLLDIDIKTGRKNQIRVQLASRNNPVVGDKKYGNVKYKRMLLEAYYLKFMHPVTKKICLVTIPQSPEFQKMMENGCK